MFASESVVLKIFESVPKILTTLHQLAKTPRGTLVLGVLGGLFVIWLFYKFIVKKTTVDMNYNRNFQFSVTYPAGEDGKVLRVLRDSLEEQIEQLEEEVEEINDEIGLKPGQLFYKKHPFSRTDYYMILEKLPEVEVGNKNIDTQRWKALRITPGSKDVWETSSDYFQDLEKAKKPEFDKFYQTKIFGGLMRLSSKTKAEILAKNDKRLKKSQKKDFMDKDYYYLEEGNCYKDFEGIANELCFYEVLGRINGENNEET